jgi:hypothetical protein
MLRCGRHVRIHGKGGKQGQKSFCMASAGFSLDGEGYEEEGCIPIQFQLVFTLTEQQTSCQYEFGLYEIGGLLTKLWVSQAQCSKYNETTKALLAWLQNCEKAWASQSDATLTHQLPLHLKRGTLLLFLLDTLVICVSENVQFTKLSDGVENDERCFYVSVASEIPECLEICNDKLSRECKPQQSKKKVEQKSNMTVGKSAEKCFAPEEIVRIGKVAHAAARQILLRIEGSEKTYNDTLDAASKDGGFKSATVKEALVAQTETKGGTARPSLQKNESFLQPIPSTDAKTDSESEPSSCSSSPQTLKFSKENSLSAQAEEKLWDDDNHGDESSPPHYTSGDANSNGPTTPPYFSDGTSSNRSSPPPLWDADHEGDESSPPLWEDGDDDIGDESSPPPFEENLSDLSNKCSKINEKSRSVIKNLDPGDESSPPPFVDSSNESLNETSDVSFKIELQEKRENKGNIRIEEARNLSSSVDFESKSSNAIPKDTAFISDKNANGLAIRGSRMLSKTECKLNKTTKLVDSSSFSRRKHNVVPSTSSHYDSITPSPPVKASDNNIRALSDSIDALSQRSGKIRKHILEAIEVSHK